MAKKKKRGDELIWHEKERKRKKEWVIGNTETSFSIHSILL
jgi:hypothetical protein